MTVSVVIAAYDAEQHLERAVRSALEQTAPAYEVVVVDDDSRDGTLALAHRLAEQHPQVKVHALTENSGPAAARNAALDAATGDWVAILDADDAFTPGRLETLVQLGEQRQADVVLDNFVFRSAASGQLRPSRIRSDVEWEPVDLHRFLRAARAFNYEPTWTLLQPLIRRDFLERHQLRYPTHTRHGEDYLFMVDVLLSGARCVRSGPAGYLYTERAQGASTTRLDYRGLVEQTVQLLDDPRLDRRARRLLRTRLATLRCLAAERDGPSRLLATAVRSPGVAATLARRVGRRVQRVVGRRPVPELPRLL